MYHASCLISLFTMFSTLFVSYSPLSYYFLLHEELASSLLDSTPDDVNENGSSGSPNFSIINFLLN